MNFVTDYVYYQEVKPVDHATLGLNRPEVLVQDTVRMRVGCKACDKVSGIVELPTHAVVSIGPHNYHAILTQPLQQLASECPHADEVVRQLSRP